MKSAIFVGLILCLVPFAQVQAATSTPLSTSITPSFDHTRTGFLLRDVHATLRCEQCHVDGIFKNTPKDCAGCHATGTRVSARPKPVNHVQTIQPCDACHTSPTSFLVKSFNHLGVVTATSGQVATTVTGCAGCHNSQSLNVTSKPATHFPTLLACETCHTNTASFADWKMNHTSITSGCAQCHQGQFPNVINLPPVPTNHVPVQAGQDCSACHGNFTTFLGAVFDHSAIGTATCTSCHGGIMPGVVTLPAVPAKHITIPAGNDCNVCHFSVVSFLGAKYDHAGVTTGSCDTCHTGVYPGVLAKSANHIPVLTMKCDACHTAINTSGYTSFLSAQYHVLNTASSSSCASCHNGSYASNASAYGVANAAGGHITIGSTSCDTCHTASNTALYTSFTGATYHTSQTAAAGGCVTCHTGSVTTLSATGRYPEGMAQAATLSGVAHIPTSATCDTCHTQATTVNFTTFLGAVFDHTSVSGGVAGICSSCHNGTKAKGMTVPPHIATSAQCDSSGCHTQATTANYTTFAGGSVHPGTAVAVGSCATGTGCHNASGASQNALAMPTPHPLTSITQCDSASGCHIAGSTSNFSTWLGAKYHTTGLVNVKTAGTAVGSCASAGCHDGTGTAYTALGTASAPTTHVTVVVASTACDSCHSNTLSYTTWLGAGFDHTGVVVGTCLTCHDGVQASGKPTLHVPTTAGVSCDSAGCHAGTTVTGTANVALGYPSAWAGVYTYSHTAVVAGTCATCHGGTYPGVSSKTYDPHDGLATSFVHSVTTASCDTCHTATNTTNYTTWLGAGYAHNATTDALKCATSACHGAGGAGKGVTATHVPITGVPSCDSGGCHKIYGGTVTTFANAVMSHTVVTSILCGTCHNGSYTTQGTYGALAKVTNHIPTTIVGSADCNTCHKALPPATVTSGAAAWNDVTVSTMNHNSVQGAGKTLGVYCVTCHLSGVSYLGNMSKKSHNGASTAKDCSFSGCHIPIGSKGKAYTSWK